MKFAARELIADESGGALIEYALVMALVSMVAFAVLSEFGDVLSSYFSDTAGTLAQTAELAR